MLLFADLCDLASDFEDRCFAIGIGHGDFGFSSAAAADGDREGGAVYVAGSSLFDDIHLDGVEGEDPQGEANLMAAGDSFAVVGINKIPTLKRPAGQTLNGEIKFVHTICTATVQLGTG